MSDTIHDLNDLQAYRDAILEIARRYHVRRVSVFGSWARGTATPDSDIDFLMEFEPDYTLRDLIRLVQALQTLLGRKVDVADVRQLRDEFRPSILQDARPL